MTRNRKLVVGAAFPIALAVLGVAQIALEKQATAQAKTAVQAPRFEVDPLWPKPLPNHWLLGMTIGVSVDKQDHVWIIHRSSSTLNETERGAELKIAECCTGAPPVLQFDQAGNLISSWGGPEPGRRMARVEPRHRRRRQGQRLDWRQRPERWPDPEADQGRQADQENGLRLRPRRQQRSVGLPPAGQDLRRRCQERGVHFGRLRQPPRRGARLRNRRVQALLGRLRQQAERRQPGTLQSDRAAAAAVPQPGALRRPVQGQPALRVRPGQRPHPGVHA